MNRSAEHLLGLSQDNAINGPSGCSALRPVHGFNARINFRGNLTLTFSPRRGEGEKRRVSPSLVLQLWAG